MSSLKERIRNLSPEQRELLEALLNRDESPAERVSYTPPRDQAEEKLAAIWSDVLGVRRVGIHDNFFHLGGDSIQCIRVAAKAREAGLQITTDMVLRRPTIAELAAVAEDTREPEPDPEPVIGPVPLTPIQRWFVELNLPDPNHWNQVMRFEVDDRVTNEALRRALDVLVERHDSLRLRCESTVDGWVQTCEPPRPAPLAIANGLEEASVLPAGAIDLGAGHLFGAAITSGGIDGPRHLVVVAHHLAVDGISFRILAEDLQLACEQAVGGNAIRLSPPRTTFTAWARHCTMLADQPQIRAQLDYWRSIQSETIGPLPVSRRGPNLESSAETVAATLDCDTTTELLRLSPSRYRARFADVLLAAVVHQIARSTNALRLLFDCESHGREAEGTLDLSHVTGWFTAMYPLAFSPGSTFAQALADVRRRIREVPMQGIGFGMLRYCCSDAGIRHSLAQGRAPEVLFNYLGQFDDAVRSVPWFRYIPDQSMASYGPTNPRAHVWQIFGAVLNGEFRLQWTFSHNLHDRTTIETLAGKVIETLRRAASDTSVAALTPEDFPDADLTREDLRVIVQGHG